MFKLTFDTGNEAFQDGQATLETSRILREVATLIGKGFTEHGVHDINGNRVGSYVLKHKDARP